MGKTFKFLITFICVMMSVNVSANSSVVVKQVSENVVITDDVDYMITSDTPFSEQGMIDIVNTEHAVLIFTALKPSKAIAQLSHVKINGQRAVNNTNCQVKIHNRGAIIMPYASDIKPLTVFSQPNFEGEAVNDFGLENSGGFMNTLSAEKLNNRIQSFKLKRGYMVTFSTLPRGRGYSRCFIADDNDLEIAQLPEILAGRISSYRIFKWNDNSKAGIANDTRADPCAKLNVTSCYSFGLGENRGNDTECVPHHIYEDWPSASACGSVTYSPHMKTNNEPGNSADDHPQTVDQILDNWENLMATGMRLCSPSSHDGSINHLRAFLDSIDARGWRCDIIDLHCYWPEGSFSSIKSSWVDRYHRPIWISEWVWGASWNNNGIFGVATGNNRDNPTQSQLNQNKTAVQNICNNLNSWDYIERYFYWNSEANCSKLYLSNGTLTPAGEFYAGMNTGVGYRKKYDFVPTTPRQYGISDYQMVINDGNAVLSWYDKNGEFNRLMEVQRKLRGGQWEVLDVIEQKETAAKYSYVDENSPEGAQYRIHIVDLQGMDRYTNDDLGVGDLVQTTEGLAFYAGGNQISNGDFNMGMTGWNAGNGKPISLPYFQAVAEGGYQGGPYLQAYGSGGVDNVASIKQLIDIQPGQDYIFSISSKNIGSFVIASLSENGSSASKVVAQVKDNNDWNKQSFVFNSDKYDKFLLAFRWLSATAQIDKVELRPLFSTRNEAVADGVGACRKQAEAIKTYNVTLPALNDEMTGQLAAITGTDDEALAMAENAVDGVLNAIRSKKTIDSLLVVAEKVSTWQFPGKAALEVALEKAKTAADADGICMASAELSKAMAEFLPMVTAENQPIQPKFATSNGWEVKVGTYTGGDQRTNTVKGKTCWNAWWSNLNASLGQTRTMEVRQKLDKLPEGLYALECKATTEHYCLSDQHGYIKTDKETATTPNLEYDFFDIPTVGNIWQTLTSTPVYVGEGGSLTIGFVSSKQGAVDNAWHPFGNAENNGDKREGWWCATDFNLLFHPIRMINSTAGEWGTACLPYAYQTPEGTTTYRIAGILSDLSKICIEPVETIEAGQPCIYLAEGEQITFYEYGEKAKEPLPYADENNLMGFFQTSARAPKGSFVLQNGAWVQVSKTRPVIDDFTAIIYKLDNLQVLSTWNGKTMDIVYDPDAIESATLEGQDKDEVRRYSLSGQAVNQPKGVYIEKRGKNVRKYSNNIK